MKRKVRITPPASNPFESNPMSTWMAQMGGTQMDQNQPTEEEHIYSIAAEMLSQGFDTEEVKKSLAGNGFSVGKVNELVDSLVAYVEEQRDLTEANYLEDEDTQEQLLAEQEAASKEAMEEEALQNQMYDDMYYAESDPGYAEEDAVMQEVLMRFGGKVPTKKEFVKKSLQLKKKQQGGQEQENKADDTFASKRPLQDFVSSVANTAQQKAEEEMYEQQYDNYFGTDNNLDEAQWGGMRGQQRRMARRANRAMRKMPQMPTNIPFLPNYGVGSMPILPSTLFPLANTLAGQMSTQIPNYTQLANIEVRRTGLFGRPKEYSMNFNTVQPSQVKQEEIVNQEKQNTKATEEDAALAEKEKETTTASKDNETVQEELVTADQITVGGKKATPVKGTSPKIKDVEGSTPQVKKDKWGRPEGSEWYGFDPEKKQFTNQVSPAKAIVDKANAAYNRSFNPVTGTYQTLGLTDSNEEYYYPTRMQNAYYKVGDKWYMDNNAYSTDATGKNRHDWYGSDQEYNDAIDTPRSDFKYAINPDKKLYEITDPSRIKSLNQNAVKVNKNAKNPTYGYVPNKSKKSNYLSYIPEGALRAANTLVNETNTFVDQMRKPFQQTGGVTGEDLYKFIYGGNEMMPFADESFMYDSKDTTDPYFKYGGLNTYQKQGEVAEEQVELRDKTGNLVKIVSAAEAARNKEYDQYTQKNVKVDNTQTNTNTTAQNNQYPGMYPFPIYPPVFGGRRRFSPYANPAIQYAGSWTQQKGLPFDPRTGKPIMGLPASNLPISKIDVTKSSLFGKRPKEYTVYYGDYNKGQAPKGTGSAPAGNMSTDQLRQYSGFQNVLANIPGLSKFVRDPKGDYVSKEGFVSPKDIEQIDKLPIKPLDFTNKSAEELKARAEAKLEGAPMQLATRRASAIPTQSGLQEEPIQRTFSIDERIPEPYFTDEEIAAQNPLVDVEPEDLSQDYTAMPSELAVNRNPEVVSPIVNTAGPMADMNYSYDMPGEGENYPEEYQESFSPEREYMLESLGRGSSNVPYYPSFISESPVVGPEGMADYLSGALNYNMDLPYQPEAPQPWMTQQMVDESNKRNQERQAAALRRKKELERIAAQEEARKQTTVKPNKNNKDTEPTVPSPEEIDRKNNPNLRFLTRQKQINLENQVEDWDEYINSGLDLETYLYKKATGESIKESESARKSKEYQEWARDQRRRNYGFQQGGLYKAQTGVNQNSVNNQDDSQIPMMKPKTSQEVWAVTEPQIRQAWGLEETKTPEIEQDPFAVTYRNRNMYNIDFEKGLNTFNTAANFGVAGLNAFTDKKSQENFYANLPFRGQTSKQTMNRGDYDPNSGLFRPDQMGFEGVAQKGGSMYKEGGETYMSAKQIADYLANGGEIEFI